MLKNVKNKKINKYIKNILYICIVNKKETNMKRYVLEAADCAGAYYTGHCDRYATPATTPSVEKAEMYNSINDAIFARGVMKNPINRSFVIREVEVTIKPGYIVKEH